jgi:CHASE2 domain-containing sensor protein
MGSHSVPVASFCTRFNRVDDSTSLGCWRKFMMSRILKALPLGLLVGVSGLALSLFQFSHELEEDTGLGLLFKLRGVRQAPRDAVVISINRESSEHLNVPDDPDKWPRSLHARLLETLSEQGAAVVTFDVHFLVTAPLHHPGSSSVGSFGV